MSIDLTKEETKITKMILEEELAEIEDLIDNANEKDKVSLNNEANIIKSVIEKLKY